ncbi:Holliday junction resolvase RecU [Intestinimonas butyriciproducens]|uniref:Holliday junction resolvase RecU n=1 Tax=Intestinimonas butyriciproducens TaxID=1297617 RepID=UPI0031B57784
MRFDVDPRMSIQGARNRASGAFFEDAILRVCRHYWLSGQAAIDKTPEPMQPIKDLGGGRFVAHYAKKAQPDFQGNLQGGRSVCFEAKHTDSDRIKQSAVTNEQAAVLDVKEALGALCFVLVSFGFREFYRVPWAVWRDMRAHFGHKYMTPEEGAAYRLPVTMGLLLFLDPKDYDHER